MSKQVIVDDRLVGRLPGSTDAECTSGHKLRVIRRAGRINAIATYREHEQWWEYIDASEPFCPECGGEIACTGER